MIGCDDGKMRGFVSQTNGSISTENLKESTRVKTRFSSHSILDSPGFLSFRTTTDKDIVRAAYQTLSEVIGDFPTITIGDIYNVLVGSRGSRAWDSIKSSRELSPSRIGRVLTANGFTKISSPHRTARYQPPSTPPDLGVNLCETCLYDNECDLKSHENSDSSVCGIYENKNLNGVTL